MLLGAVALFASCKGIYSVINSKHSLIYFWYSVAFLTEV